MKASRKIFFIILLLAGASALGLGGLRSQDTTVAAETFQACFELARAELKMSPSFDPVFLSKNASSTLTGATMVTMIFEVPDGFVRRAVPYTIKCNTDENGVGSLKIRKH